MGNYIAAIDFGTTETTLLVGEKRGLQHIVLSCHRVESKGVIRGEVVNIGNLIEITKSSVKEVEKELKVKIQKVVVSISGRSISTRAETLVRRRGDASKLITEEEVEEMKREVGATKMSEGEKVLHVIPQFYNVDDNLGMECAIGLTGNEILGDYKLLVVKENLINRTNQIMKESNLEASDIILSSIASAEAVLNDDEKELGVALVDIGGGTSELTIFHKGAIRYAATIPFGGNAITDDLRYACSISLRNAEMMKIKFGSSYAQLAPKNTSVSITAANGIEKKEFTFGVISEIIEARMEEILEALLYQIKESGYRDKLAAGVVITGGVSQTIHLEKLAKEKFELNVRIAAPNNAEDREGKTPLSPHLSTAIGLLKLGFLNEKEELGVIPIAMEEETLFSEEEMGKREESEAVKEKSQTRKRGKSRTGINQFFTNIFGDSNNEA